MDDAEETRRVVLRMLELFDDGTASSYGSLRFLDLVDEHCDWVEQSSDARFAGRRGDKASIRRATEESQAALRDRHANVKEVIVEADRAAVVWTWSATSVSRPLSATVYSIFSVAGGRITRWHDTILSEPAGG